MADAFKLSCVAHQKFSLVVLAQYEDETINKWVWSEKSCNYSLAEACKSTKDCVAFNNLDIFLNNHSCALKLNASVSRVMGNYEI
jgi:hypothetical protein